MTQSLFTPDEVWRGGHYELYLELSPPSAQERISVLEAIWSHPALEGCHLDNSVESSQQPRVQAGEHEDAARLYGIAQLPNQTRVACGTYAFTSQEEDEPPQHHAVAMFIPMSALSAAYPVGPYPFGPMEKVFQWKSELDDWLAEIGEFVYERAPFALGLVGFEVNTMEAISVESLVASGIPDQRFDGILWPRGTKLEWYPATKP
jgi:hypothetical protein